MKGDPSAPMVSASCINNAFLFFVWDEPIVWDGCSDITHAW